MLRLVGRPALELETMESRQLGWSKFRASSGAGVGGRLRLVRLLALLYFAAVQQFEMGTGIPYAFGVART